MRAHRRDDAGKQGLDAFAEPARDQMRRRSGCFLEGRLLFGNLILGQRVDLVEGNDFSLMRQVRAVGLQHRAVRSREVADAQDLGGDGLEDHRCTSTSRTRFWGAR